jgi:large subunit ribosomal protein L3
MPVQGLLGKKIGMTQVFKEDGSTQPVTAIEAGPCVVTQIKTEVRDGYEAVQLGFDETSRLSSPERGHLKRAGKSFRHLREFKTEDLSEAQVGEEIRVSVFQAGDKVDVVGFSKGRGFAGGVKRHGFKGGPKTHGQSDRLRAPGSIGAGTYPGRVWKGQKMAGHMGNARVTARNLEVVSADDERNILLVKGAIPGGKGNLLMIRKSGKSSGDQS